MDKINKFVKDVNKFDWVFKLKREMRPLALSTYLTLAKNSKGKKLLPWAPTDFEFFYKHSNIYFSKSCFASAREVFENKKTKKLLQELNQCINLVKKCEEMISIFEKEEFVNPLKYDEFIGLFWILPLVNIYFEPAAERALGKVPENKVFSITYPVNYQHDFYKKKELLDIVENKRYNRLNEYRKKWKHLYVRWMVGKVPSNQELIAKGKEMINGGETIENIEKERKKLIRTSNKLANKYNLSRIEHEFSRKCVWFRTYRMDVVQKFFVALESNIKRAYPKASVYSLIGDVLEKRFKKHRTKMLYLLSRQKGLLSPVFVKKVPDVFKEKKEEQNEIKGVIAYSGGKVRSRVNIIKEKKDLEKMNQGDVLVTSMTTPELIPAIKKASAIVTDEGGITCHAAIVSRELKTPCIVGTGHATNVFKDGDRVEIDAKKGIVRRIK